jgi:hypothetical protein
MLNFMSGAESMPKLDWKLLIKRRWRYAGLPLGKQDLAWVTNTVTLI